MTSQSQHAAPAHNIEDSSDPGSAGVRELDGKPPRHKRHRAQPSSSFRLGAPTRPRVRQPDNAATFAQNNANSQRTHRSPGSRKRQADYAEPSIPKRHSRHSHRHDHAYRPSVGSSPLAHNIPQTPEVESSSSRDVSMGHAPNSPAVGLDSDPAQIVKLALSLNESRKRSSSGRNATGGTQRRRTTSTALSHSTNQDGFGSPNVEEADWQLIGGSHHSTTAADSQERVADTLDKSTLPSAVAASFANSDQNPPDFSAATLARAEKARKHFELFSEYLRLLPHLPPLPDHGSYFSTIENEMTAQARDYNPLQYIRNSKVRYRERQPLDSQAEGWEDPEKVRDWVDEVVTNYGLSPHKANECLQLPPLTSQKTEDLGPHLQSSSLQPSKSNVSDSGRPRRPRRDWFTSPSDLLADAAWLEAGSNKLKIEDADGNKVFPSGVKFTPVKSSTDPEPPASIPEESPKAEDNDPPRFLQPADALPNFNSVNGSTRRGRRRHRLTHSLHLTPSHSHSHSRNTSTSGWRKRSGSFSSADSSGSDNESRHWGKRFSRRGKKHSAHHGKEYFDLGGAVMKLDSQGSSEAKAPSSPDKHRDSRRRALLPALDIEKVHSTSPLPSPGGRAALTPSALNAKGERQSARVSVEEVDTAHSSPVQKDLLPSITISLSPARGRSVSPLSGGHTLRRNKHTGIDESKQPSPDGADNDIFNTPFSPTRQAKKPGLRRTESSPIKVPRISNQQESKIRGMFKGGRIAEIVGNEVSKVGGFIRKKDHSRQSSSASSILSEAGHFQDSEMDNINKAETITEFSHLRNVRSWDSPKYHPPVLREFRPTPRRRDGDHSQFRRGSQALTYSDDYFQGRINSSHRRNSSSLVALRSFTDDDSARNSTGATPRLDSRRSRLSNVNRISSRSISKYPDSINISRREIARVRAHLLSSGVKALELRRHAEVAPNMCLEAWVNGQSTFDAVAPYIARSEETIMTAQKFINAFDSQVTEAQASLMDFSTSKIPGLKSDLERLERFFETSIAPRTNEMVTQLDDMTNEVSTTGTLAINQLHDALDRGIRKRNRRLRWASRLGYVFLEWMLVGVMWWVWMVVMGWKIFRGIWRGTVSGIRWVLWL